MSPHLLDPESEMERARRMLVLLEVMPFAHACLFDWWGDHRAVDGTPVDSFCNSWTRETITLSADGRLSA